MHSCIVYNVCIVHAISKKDKAQGLEPLLDYYIHKFHELFCNVPVVNTIIKFFKKFKMNLYMGSNSLKYRLS